MKNGVTYLGLGWDSTNVGLGWDSILKIGQHLDFIIYDKLKSEYFVRPRN